MTARVHHADLWGPRQAKYDWLNNHDAADTHWKELKPDQPFYLFVPQDTKLLGEYQVGWNISDVFPVNSVGIVTARDNLTIHETADKVWKTIVDFATLAPESAREKYLLGEDANDWQVALAQKDLKASGPTRERIVPILYRPFDTRFTYYTGTSRGFLCRPRPEVMRHMVAGENIGLQTCRQRISQTWQHLLTTKFLVDDSCVSNKTRERGYLFPLYLYPDPGKMVESSAWPAGKDGRRPNLAPDFVKDFSARLGLEFVSDGQGDLKKTFGPEDVFHYAYAVFHSPTYRSRYAEFLKIDFPRLPLTGEKALFAALVRLGRELTALHLLENVPAPAARYPRQGDNVVQRVDYKPPTSEISNLKSPSEISNLRSPSEISNSRSQISQSPGRVCINDRQYFDNVPPEVFAFHVGGYQVCQRWLKDRKGRSLSYDDIEHYRRITEAVRQTLRLMDEIDRAIPAWPFA